MSRLRQRVAERLLQSQSTAAILTTFNEVNMQPILDLRAKYKDRFEKEHGVKLGFMGFFVKAAVHALKKYPAVNASIDGTDIVYHGYFDIGIAVGSPRGLVVPILRDADQMSLAEIEKQIAEYGKRANEGKLTVQELTGGTYTISNGGVFGSMLSTPIINPPQSAILGVHATKERAVVENGQVVVRPINYLAQSYDHRIIDGREAVLSLVAIKEALEDPGAACCWTFEECAAAAADLKMAEPFDVVVIGAGPGGYIAAIRAAQLGFRVACIDDWTRADGKPAPGGTCTNVGCIPSKALLQSSENFEHAGHAFADHGIEVKGLAIDVAKMLARKDRVVAQNNDGILYLFKKNKVAFFHGKGSFAGKEGDAWRVNVTGAKPAELVRPACDRRDGLAAAAAAGRDHRQRPRARQRRCAGDSRRAEEARRRRRRRDRPRDGQRLAAPGRGGDGARSAARVSRRGRQRGRQGGAEAVHASRASPSTPV